MLDKWQIRSLIFLKDGTLDMCCKFVKVNDQFITFQDYLVIEILFRQHKGIAVFSQFCA